MDNLPLPDSGAHVDIGSSFTRICGSVPAVQEEECSETLGQAVQRNHGCSLPVGCVQAQAGWVPEQPDQVGDISAYRGGWKKMIGPFQSKAFCYSVIYIP